MTFITAHYTTERRTRPTSERGKVENHASTARIELPNDSHLRAVPYAAATCVLPNSNNPVAVLISKGGIILCTLGRSSARELKCSAGFTRLGDQYSVVIK